MIEQLPSQFVTARRIAWTEARARNAAKRGWLIASVGLVAVVITVVVLVMLPREVNRLLTLRIDALPALADTVLLHSRMDSAQAVQQRADSNLRALRTADADRVAVDAQKDELPDGTVRAPGRPSESDARRDLGVRVARARAAPLVESYRAVGEAELLRGDSRINALMDSLTSVNRDREAYAALGGADAHYAALTARIATIGQRLLVIAEQQLAAGSVTQVATLPPQRPTSSVSATTVTSTTVPAPTLSRTSSSASPVKATPDSVALRSDTSALAPPVQFNADSIADRRAQATFDSATAALVSAGQSLISARRNNADIISRRNATRAEFTVVVPQLAMVLAALVLGLAIGYGVAFAREVRHPRIADVAEVERITQARVIVHAESARRSRAMGHRHASDNAIPKVIDTTGDSYQLLHVTLSGFGDSTRVVRVLSDSPVMTATVGINLAAAAAREARSVLLIDADNKSHLAATLLNATHATGVAEALTTPTALATHVTRVAIGRDHFVKALFAGLDRARKSDVSPAKQEEFTLHLQQLIKDHDLTVILASTEMENSHSWLPACDVILCVRVGHTRLNWLTRSVLHLRASGIRLRAVFLWAADAPKVR